MQKWVGLFNHILTLFARSVLSFVSFDLKVFPTVKSINQFYC